MSAARRLYTVAWIAAAPLVAVYLLWRSLRQREYRQHWSERFLGAGARPAGAGPVVWVHAVSVGETRAAQPLITALAAARPELQFVLTHMTPTGRAVGESLAAQLPGRLVQRYLPYELPLALRRFLRETRPALGVVMETEVWPNLLAATRAAGVPVALVNARLSEKSLARALRWPTLMHEAARGFDRVLAQAAGDAQRLRMLYEGPIEIVGNLKFDLTPDAALVERGRAMRAGWGERPVWLCASTREGEEAQILAAFAAGGRPHAATLCIVPRHPQRFDEVARLIEGQGLRVARRSAGWPQQPVPGTVLLGDTMGEMALYYAACDVALIGGSLLPFGAQNLIEACAVGVPVVLGPSTFNFEQAARDALTAGAAVQVPDAPAAIDALAQIGRDAARRAQMQAVALAFAQAHRGATARTVAALQALLTASAGR